MSLLLRGVADDNASAYGPFGGEKRDFEVPAGVGLLSFAELEQGVPVADGFKFPRLPVWILHGGDHFTVLWEAEAKAAKGTRLCHWNGLKPGGPRLAELLLEPAGEAPKAPERHKETHFKRLPGEIEDVVQCHEADKKERPGAYDTWRSRGLKKQGLSLSPAEV